MITIKEVREAYRNLGYLPLNRDTYAPQEKRCCPLAALYLQEYEFQSEDKENEVIQWACTEHGSDYINELLKAIDQPCREPITHKELFGRIGRFNKKFRTEAQV